MSIFSQKGEGQNAQGDFAKSSVLFCVRRIDLLVHRRHTELPKGRA
jgi:hypothetical protein